MLPEIAAIIQALAALILAFFAWKSWQTARESVKATKSMERLALATEERNQPRVRGNNARQVSPSRFRFDAYNDGLAGTGLREVSVEVKESKRQEAATIQEFPLRLLDTRLGDKAEAQPQHTVTDTNIGPSDSRSFFGQIDNPDVPMLSNTDYGIILHLAPVRGDRAGIWIGKRTL